MTSVQSSPIPQQAQSVQVSELREQLIRACLRFQFMTVVDFCQWLRAVRGSSPTRNHVGKLVSRLAGKDGFLHAFSLPKTRSGGATKVYVPGEASRELLTRWADMEGGTWNYPAKMQNYSYSYVSHNLTVSRLAICAALFCRERQSYTLSELRLWHEMTGNPPRVNPETEGEQTAMTAIPDCFLYLQRVADGRGHALWIEVDNATTFRQTFLRRLRARLSLFESKVYAQYFGTAAVAPCYAILGKSPELAKARLKNLCQWTNGFLVKEEREYWGSSLRFAAIDYETLYKEYDRIFTASIWHSPGKPGDTVTHPLLSPLNVTEETHEHNTTPAREMHTDYC